MKRRHHIYVKGLVILGLHFLLSYPIYSQGSFPVDAFMGVNINRGDNPEMMTCAGIVREFHDWAIDEGDRDTTAGQPSPPFPNQEFRWNPGYQMQTEVRFDDWYDAINAQGVTICADMHFALPKYALADGNNFDGRQIYPINWNTVSVNDITNLQNHPEHFVERADWIYHFITRYGVGSGVLECELKYGPDSETTETNRGNVTYLESWNEPDKWWLGPNAEFSAAEYAAMASADFDGHEGAVTTTVVGDCNDDGTAETNTYPVGIQNAGSNVSFVMGGTVEVDWNWILEMNQWFATNRSDQQFIFDVINFHHYSNTNINNGNWISPEEDGLKGLLEQTVALRDAQFPGKELWLSEFGYDTNNSNNSNGNGPDFLPIGNNSPEELQAQWTVRSFLEIAAAGFDRAMVHDLQDGSSNPIGAWDTHTGLVTEGGTAKEAWYYVSTMRNVLRGTSFVGEMPPGNCVGTEFDCQTECARVYRFENGQDCPDGVTWAIWSPTSCDKATYNYNLPLECEDRAVGLFMQAPFTNGVIQPLVVQNNEAIVPVSETPVFVREIEGKIQTPACVDFINAETRAIDCSTVELTWNIPAGESYNFYQVWYGLAGQIDDTDSPDYLSELTNVTHHLAGNETSIIIGGLLANTEYVFYVMPENEYGVPVNLRKGRVRWCSTNLTTTGELCQIEITEDMIYCDDGTGSPFTELFDEQQSTDFCGDASTGQMLVPNTTWAHFIPGQPNTTACLNLGEPFDISHFYLFDGTSAGWFEIEWSANGQDNWQPLGRYFTGLLEEWTIFTDFVMPSGDVQFLRFKNIEDDGRLAELIICGEPVEDTSTEICNISILEGEALEKDCTTAGLKWLLDAKNTCKIKGYQLFYDASNTCFDAPPPTAIEVIDSPDAEVTYFELSELTPNQCYCFYLRGIDEDGTPTDWITVNVCSKCEETCICKNFIPIVTKGMGISSINGPDKMTDEQETIQYICQEDICSDDPNTNSNVPVTEWLIPWTATDVSHDIIFADGNYMVSGVYIFDVQDIGDLTIKGLTGFNQEVELTTGSHLTV